MNEICQAGRTEEKDFLTNTTVCPNRREVKWLMVHCAKSDLRADGDQQRLSRGTILRSLGFILSSAGTR